MSDGRTSETSTYLQPVLNDIKTTLSDCDTLVRLARIFHRLEQYGRSEHLLAFAIDAPHIKESVCSPDIIHETICYTG